MRIPARAIVGFAIYSLLTPALLLLVGGDPCWAMGWAYSGLFLASILGSRLAALKRSPELLRERSRFTDAEGIQAGDRLLVVLVGLLGPLAIVVVAGLDHRLHWSGGLGLAPQAVAMVFVALGYLAGIWAMLQNPYFSAVVRIQSDRGQVVVGTGPYAIVRHPAYAGAIISSLATPIALDAWWVLVPGLLIVVAIIIRTAREDQELRDKLAGYEVYARRVKSRLVPGVW